MNYFNGGEDGDDKKLTFMQPLFIQILQGNSPHITDGKTRALTDQASKLELRPPDFKSDSNRLSGANFPRGTNG